MKAMKTIGFSLGLASGLASAIGVASPANAFEHGERVLVNNMVSAEVAFEAAYLLDMIDEAYARPWVLDQEFFASLSRFGPETRVQKRFFRALAGIDWYRNDYARQWVYANHSRYYRRFVARNQVDLFVRIGGGEGTERLENAVNQYLAAYLPEYAGLAYNARSAELVVRVNLAQLEPVFGRTKRTQKDEKYPKRIRKAANPQERLLKAHYTKVREYVTLMADVQIALRAQGRVIDRTRVRDRWTRNFIYGEGLRASTAYGFRATNIFPGNKVRSRFAVNIEAERARALNLLERQMAQRIAIEIASMQIPLAQELAPGRFVQNNAGNNDRGRGRNGQGNGRRRN